MLVLSETQKKELIEHAIAGLPNEVCGLLGGVVEGQIRRVEKVYNLTNLDLSPEHFTMDPREQFEVVRDLREKGWQLIGNFHSHPSTPARPSQEDITLAHDPEASYLIISLADSARSTVKSYRIRNGQVSEEPIAAI